MMVLPLLIIVLLPKVVNTNDPEMRKVKTSWSTLHHAVQSVDPFVTLTSLHVCFSSQEMEQSMNMLNPNPELPDVSEFMTKLFSKGSTKQGSGSKGSRSAAVKRR